MSSENEKLRALLQQALDMLEEQALHIEAPILPAGERLLDRIRAALAEPVEPAPTHDLYRTGDETAPDAIKDRNGEVVLDLCKHCGQGEAELAAECPAQTAPQPEQIDLNAAIQKAFELGGLEDGSYHLEADELEQVVRAALAAQGGE